MQLSTTLLNNVTDFIIKESGLDKKIDSAIIRNKNITLDDKIKLHFMTFDFIKSLVSDFTTNQGNTWLIGSNTIMPSDILVIYKNIIINMSFIESYFDTLHDKLDLEFNHKYNLDMIL